MLTTMEKFNEWLQAEMDKRGWNQSELARRAGFFPSSLNRVLGGTRKLGADMAVGIARALHMRPERVMFQAGLIPTLPKTDDLIEEIDSILEDWTEDERRQWVELTRLRNDQISQRRAERAAMPKFAGRTASESKESYGANGETDDKSVK